MNLQDAIKTGVRAGLLNTMVSAPAIIKSFNPATQTVTAEIAIKRIVDGENVSYPLLLDVPVILPTVQGFHITMPIKAGDEALVVFADRCIDNWHKLGGTQKQAEHRAHHISDGFAIIGVNSEPNKITGYDAENMTIRNTSNNQKITLKASGDIEVDTVKDVNINCANANITASASVKIDSPSTEITGLLKVGGAVTMDATLAVSTSVSTASVIASTSLAVAGVEMKGHKHGGVQTGTGVTGVPQ